jgi:hypothetical protein
MHRAGLGMRNNNSPVEGFRNPIFRDCQSMSFHVKARSSPMRTVVAAKQAKNASQRPGTFSKIARTCPADHACFSRAR